MSTHIEVSHRAQFLLSDHSQPSSKTPPGSNKKLIANMLAQNRPFVQAGSYFPDWGYACAGQSDAAEEAHWPPFWNASIAYFSEKYHSETLPQWTPHLASPDSAALASFLFGVISHGIADASWHSLGMDEGFIETMQHSMFDGSYSDSHSNADIGGEFMLARMGSSHVIEDTWHIPTNDIVAIYDRMGHNVTAGQLNTCMLLGYTAAQANKLVGRYLFPGWASKSPFLTEQYFSFFRGGIDDMAMWVAECWTIAINWFITGTMNPLCKNMGVDWAPTPEKDAFTVSTAQRASIRHRLFRELPEYQPENTTRVTSTLIQCLKDSFVNSTEFSTIDTRGDMLSATTIRLSSTSPVLAFLFRKCTENLYIHATNSAQPIKSIALSRISHLAQIGIDLARAGFDQIQTTVRTYLGIGCSSIDRLSIPQERISFTSRESYAALGFSMTSGDFDGDGRPDLVVGAPGYSAHSGAAFIFYGKGMYTKERIHSEFIEDAASLILRQAANDTDSIGARFGTSMTVVDMNQDGVDDLAISAPMYRAHSMQNDYGYDGCIYVLFGGKGKGLRKDGQWDLIIRGQVQRMKKKDPRKPRFDDDQFLVLGTTLYGLDVNGDGFKDLIVGSPYASPLSGTHQRGMVQAFFSSSMHIGIISHLDSDWTVSGTQDYEWFGKSVDIMVDQDSRILLVGSPGYKLINIRKNVASRHKTKSSGRIYGYLLGVFQRPIIKFTLSSASDYAQFGSNVRVVNNGVVAVGAPSQTSDLSSRRFMNLPGILISHLDIGYQAGIVHVLDLSALFGDKVLHRDVLPIAELHGSGSLGHFGAVIEMDVNHQGIFIAEHMVEAETGKLRWIPLSGLTGRLSVSDVGSYSACWTTDLPRMQFGRSFVSLHGIGLVISSTNAAFTKSHDNISAPNFSHGFGDGAVHILFDDHFG
ncbi:hypothetical protein BASA61_009481 [Batrachochytrium salamandrivorans]|nr:hypothetical protein BASA62_004932 [Batrachochytrium salamandrivorans]KAH6578902.1 hypothetical protein BASA60_003491 [Batrachochytrium salamandrivorans]KAH6580670.1 hypothetical protein BASA61_009481 [Batrachochytrium salamandrivorans]